MAGFRFTDRIGGVSAPPYNGFNLASHVGDDPAAVAKNRMILSELISIPKSRIFYMNQVHGAEVAIIDSNSDSNNAPSVDALFTMLPGAALVTLVADCVPVLLSSKDAIAAVHIGRRGLMVDVLEATLRIFNDHGVSNTEIRAEIGPSICGDCYEVDLDLYREVVAAHPATATNEVKHSLDIAAGVCARLDQYGIEYRKGEECTMHSKELFSYRRDGVTGRQAGVIWL